LRSLHEIIISIVAICGGGGGGGGLSPPEKIFREKTCYFK